MDNTDIQTSLPRQKETENRILLDSLPETSVQRRGPVWQVLWFLASLKITVVLLALCMVLVFASTLAQIDASNWKVVNTFFGLRSFLIWIPFQDFVNLYNRELKVSGAFPFPGGMTLGILLLVNLLAAHAVRFQLKWQRLGILILHAGLILLLLGELETRTFAVEGTMAIDEGSSSSVVLQSHNLELAIASPSEDADFDDVVSVPASLLQRDHLIHDEMLPFDIDVVRYMANSALLPSTGGGDSPRATAGEGLRWVAVQEPEVSGTDQAVNVPSAYLTFKTRQGQDLGTWLVTAHRTQQQPQLFESQPVVVDGKTYQVSLRPRHSYRPFSLHLVKFSFDRYEGTDMARNYSSLVRLVDPQEKVDREVLIKMNEPLRYRGEAFYQSSFDNRTEKTTYLQVVRNPGWQIPYVSCGLVALGLLVHFVFTLVNFLNRRVAA